MRLRNVVVLMASVLVIPVASFSAEPVTHLGQSPDDHVMLELVGVGPGGCELGIDRYVEFIRNLPDGTSESEYFRVPEGRLLVITDVDWQFVCEFGAACAGKIEVLRLWAENLEDPGYSSRLFDSTITLSSTGEGGISESMTAGFVVSPEARICPDVHGYQNYLQHTILRGYLVDKPKKQ